MAYVPVTGASCNGRSFIHSFIQAISIAPLQVQHYSKALPTTARILCQSFMPKRHRQLRVKDLPKAARAELESATLLTKGTDSTNEPPRPTCCSYLVLISSGDCSRVSFTIRWASTDCCFGVKLLSLSKEGLGQY